MALSERQVESSSLNSRTSALKQNTFQASHACCDYAYLKDRDCVYLLFSHGVQDGHHIR